jgi:hypothetical protein
MIKHLVWWRSGWCRQSLLLQLLCADVGLRTGGDRTVCRREAKLRVASREFLRSVATGSFWSDAFVTPNLRPDLMRRAITRSSTCSFRQPLEAGTSCRAQQQSATASTSVIKPALEVRR